MNDGKAHELVKIANSHLSSEFHPDRYEDRQDDAQNAIISLWYAYFAHEPDQKTNHNLVGLFTTTVRNKQIDRKRQEARRQESFLDDRSNADLLYGVLAPNPETLILEQEQWDSLHQAIQGMQSPRREIVLCRLSGYDQAETAQLLNIPVGTVKSNFSRATEYLREHLGDT